MSTAEIINAIRNSNLSDDSKKKLIDFARAHDGDGKVIATIAEHLGLDYVEATNCVTYRETEQYKAAKDSVARAKDMHRANVERMAIANVAKAHGLTVDDMYTKTHSLRAKYKKEIDVEKSRILYGYSTTTVDSECFTPDMTEHYITKEDNKMEANDYRAMLEQESERVFNEFSIGEHKGLLVTEVYTHPLTNFDGSLCNAAGWGYIEFYDPEEDSKMQQSFCYKPYVPARKGEQKSVEERFNINVLMGYMRDPNGGKRHILNKNLPKQKMSGYAFFNMLKDKEIPVDAVAYISKSGKLRLLFTEPSENKSALESTADQLLAMLSEEVGVDDSVETVSYDDTKGIGGHSDRGMARRPVEDDAIDF